MIRAGARWSWRQADGGGTRIREARRLPSSDRRARSTLPSPVLADLSSRRWGELTLRAPFDCHGPPHIDFQTAATGLPFPSNPALPSSPSWDPQQFELRRAIPNLRPRIHARHAGRGELRVQGRSGRAYGVVARCAGQARLAGADQVSQGWHARGVCGEPACRRPARLEKRRPKRQQGAPRPRSSMRLGTRSTCWRTPWRPLPADQGRSRGRPLLSFSSSPGEWVEGSWRRVPSGEEGLGGGPGPLGQATTSPRFSEMSFLHLQDAQVLACDAASTFAASLVRRARHWVSSVAVR